MSRNFPITKHIILSPHAVGANCYQFVLDLLRWIVVGEQKMESVSKMQSHVGWEVVGVYTLERKKGS